MEGTLLAAGDLIQIARGDSVTSRVVFHFRDGSTHDETAVFSQRGNFRLLRYHLIQKGPTFPMPVEMSIDSGTNRATVRYANEDGESKFVDEHIELPSDLANGLVFTLLKNVRPGSEVHEVSMIAATPKPRLVKLEIGAEGDDPLSVGGTARTATHYVVKIKIGGVSGLLAPLLGKQPPDVHVWILGGEAPTFVKSEGPLYLGGPPWRIELVSPVWPSSRPSEPY